MKRFKKLSFFILCFLILFHYIDTDVKAEESKDTVSELIKYSSDGFDWSAYLYDINNGLPTSDANAIVQSRDGFIWIGGYSGLVRYDGTEFFCFDSTTGISNVVSLHIDRKDRLWVGTNDKGAAFYENDSFTFYGREQGLKSGSVRAIAEDESGVIYLATTQGIACVNDTGSLYYVNDSRLNEKYICDLMGDGNTIYGVTLNGDVFTIRDGEVQEFVESSRFPDAVPTCVYACNGEIYIGVESDYIYKTKSLSNMEHYNLIQVRPLSQVNKILSTSGGCVFVCTDNGIGYVFGNNCKIISDLPMNNSVDDCMEDMDGNLWFASSRQGVMKIVANRFKNISEAVNFTPKVINSTCLYNGYLYVGTDKGLYALDEHFKQKDTDVTELLEGVRVRCIRRDSKGNMWVCTYGEYGLVQVSADGSMHFFTEETGLNSSRVRTVLEKANGDMIVSTSGGVNIIRDGKVIGKYGSGEGVNNTEILSTCEGKNGEIYAGSDGEGIYVIEENGAIHNLYLDDGLESGVILRIKKDLSGEGYWIITGNSIAYMENEEIRTIHNFPYINNYDMYFAEDGNIWILSGNGIYVVAREELYNDKENMAYRFYGINNGIPCNATANSRSELAEDGTLYISGTSCLFSVNINEQGEREDSVYLVVPFMEADGEKIYADEDGEYRVPSDCKHLSIDAHAISYSLQNVQISYYLEGFDDKKFVADKQNLSAITYTNLNGGSYRFHLEVTDEITGEVKDQIIIPIYKEKQLHETWLFWVIIAGISILFMSICAYLIIWQRTRKLLAREKENRKFSRQIIHAFARVIDSFDKYTNGHSQRVAIYSAILASHIGYNKEKVENIYNIALLHDVGKIVVPSEILNKPAKLTEEEYEIIKSHTVTGYDILKEIETLPELAIGAHYHHERLDGKGYPEKLEGAEIPYIAKIIAVADTFDAMNSTRPYRERMSYPDIAKELRRVEGTQLDLEIVEILLKLLENGKLEGEIEETQKYFDSL